MKRYFLLLILFIASPFAFSQGKMVIGSSTISAADTKDKDMNRLVRNSYHLPTSIGDSVADTVLLKTVDAILLQYTYYCILSKDDTNRAVEVVERLPGSKGYEITTYWKNKFKKRSAVYSGNHKLWGVYVEYYQNGRTKVLGGYINDRKDGKWRYYDANGNFIYAERYSNGVLRTKPQGK